MLFALILAAQMLSPSPSASPAPPLYVPPKGWTVVHVGKSPKTQWVSEGTFVRVYPGGYSNFNVISGPNVGISLDDYVKVNVIELKRAHDGLELKQNHALALCGKNAGWLISYDLTGTTHITQVFAVNTDHAYIASYIRSLSAPEDGEAQTALQSLCAPPDAPAADAGSAPLTPPAGWHPMKLSASSNATGDNWAFMSPMHDTHASVIFVLAMPTATAESLTTDALESGLQAGMSKWATDIKVLSKDSVTLCRAEGTHYRMSAFAYAYAMNIDAVVSAGSPTSYAAFYMRRLTDEDEAPAETSIRTLCPADRQSAG